MKNGQIRVSRHSLRFCLPIEKSLAIAVAMPRRTQVGSVRRNSLGVPPWSLFCPKSTAISRLLPLEFGVPDFDPVSTNSDLF